ncbi:helix-turn-helix domain-containing protein [Alicyclobacillus dauci]|uniref:XRE family transcriptional regulator n=1 Tax=Alicyclobacillus dauci TaxID=1475485 RepID=A0ABY6Z556_9BACL|nr:XRE family transcriptional regulator [Alicyclobacillus dauci]WAH37798.1 XRE family transcriptional regulator [Alicyclobacillus dauci]
MNADDLTQTIGQTLRRLRKERDWTLDQLAQATGVSKPMLGQIERGETNPTVVTLWKIATGLKVSFASFLQELESPRVTVIRRSDQPVVADDGGTYVVRNLFALRDGDAEPIDLFDTRLAAGATHRAEPHGEQVTEGIWVKRGNLSVRLGETLYDLAEGDAIKFPADVHHSYENRGESDCEFVILLVYARG